ncbi:MAG: cytochrome c4 [Gammaproteobacteria bacterium]|nr:cytochrome c4 [Gammaproteobacteria bacterium]
MDLRDSPVVLAGDPRAGADKAGTCQACHGEAGHSVVPSFPALAGLPQSYLYFQLEEYKSGRRIDPVMSAQAQGLSEQDMLDLAAYFSTQGAKPLEASAEDQVIDRGREIYAQGDSKQGIPPCQGCHGADGRGPRPQTANTRTPWHSFPSLAGQQSAYVLSQLKAFKSGTRDSNSNARVMQGVVHGMDEATMQALAEYVKTLP